MLIVRLLQSIVPAPIFVALTFVGLSESPKNETAQAELPAKLTEIQERNKALQAELDLKRRLIQELEKAVSLQTEELNRQRQVINIGANVAQKLGPPILRDMGYLAAKNRNEKLKALLVRQKLESFIPTNEDLTRIEKARETGSFQINETLRETENIKLEIGNADKQITTLKENREKLTRAVEKQETDVRTSEQTQKQFSNLMRDLDMLAREGDKDAEKIIKGYGIKVGMELAPSGKDKTP